MKPFKSKIKFHTLILQFGDTEPQNVIASTTVENIRIRYSFQYLSAIRVTLWNTWRLVWPLRRINKTMLSLPLGFFSHERRNGYISTLFFRSELEPNHSRSLRDLNVSVNITDIHCGLIQLTCSSNQRSLVRYIFVIVWERHTYWSFLRIDLNYDVSALLLQIISPCCLKMVYYELKHRRFPTSVSDTARKLSQKRF